MVKKILSVLASITMLFAQNGIETYNCYGNDHLLIIEGRLLNKRAKNPVSNNDGWVKNLWRKSRQLINDEMKHKKIFAWLDARKYNTFSDDEGYFSFAIDTNGSLEQKYKTITLKIADNSHTATCSAPIILPKEKYLGIISDFDDTVVVSNVTKKIKLAINILFKNYKQRDAVAEMSEVYRFILSHNPPHNPSTLFFVTGSPSQLSKSIRNYLRLHHFPKYTLITKKIHGNRPDPLFDQFAYKIEKIEKLIEIYPKIEWYLFGDSGEKDREIYEFIAKKYPQKIKGIFIRNVKTEKFETVSLHSK